MPKVIGSHRQLKAFLGAGGRGLGARGEGEAGVEDEDVDGDLHVDELGREFPHAGERGEVTLHRGQDRHGPAGVELADLLLDPLLGLLRLLLGATSKYNIVPTRRELCRRVPPDAGVAPGDHHIAGLGRPELVLDRALFCQLRVRGFNRNSDVQASQNCSAEHSPPSNCGEPSEELLSAVVTARGAANRAGALARGSAMHPDLCSSERCGERGDMERLCDAQHTE
mmetsp:Transcript_7831/g.18037  ORF Transcript_7831/g.18037 Transcript_7831/m.18037 type:complete len:225 (-) Transcript_7831:102-776(-)